ncbi:hypothetical protein CLI92_05880 [Vandammella animalimorsus]|uniref:Uncharacterized protein n=1 Tax=Vandammella animalimorsus TaxID=2029117 RepID=A0A2A2T6C6_9BURK|nr:hypothetical protein [Vandammella animalimorsus]PAX17074.1 hypothetical protein CLI92_05880 [Vandammella animalimorsus]PAX19047.1 hypothetical protein CLI93_09810 [Vandammella animalimorsus]
MSNPDGFGPSDAQLRRALREVLDELVGDEAMRRRCAAVETLVVRRLNNPREAAKALLVALNSCAWWDWPAWEAFARAEGYDTLEEIERRYERIKLADVLAKASKDELGQALDVLGIEFKRSQTKAALGELLQRAGRGQARDALDGVVRRLRDGDVRKCREKMALFIASRAASKAINALRYEQLLQPDFMAHYGQWGFVCHAEISGRHCPHKKLRGKTLPASEAQRAWPQLPCQWLTCAGHISAR